MPLKKPPQTDACATPAISKQQNVVLKRTKLYTLLIALLIIIPAHLKAIEQIAERQTHAAQAAEDQTPDKLLNTVLAQITNDSINQMWDDVACLVQLGRKHGRIVTDRLAPMLGSNHPEKMRLAAARALSQLNDIERAAPVLRDLLLTAKSKETRHYTANAIGLTPRLYEDRETPEALKKALHKETDADVRIVMARALWRIGHGNEGKTVLAELMYSAPEMQTRDEAALVLAQMKFLVPKNECREQPDAELKGDVYHRIVNLSLAPTEQGERAFNLFRQIESRPRSNDEKITRGMRLLQEVLFQVQTSYPDIDETDINDLFEHASKGLVEGLDPFSQYMDREEVLETQDLLRQDYGGIGAYVGIRNQSFQIISPIYNSPAFHAGLRSMDQILAVDGERAQNMMDKGGMSRVMAKLKGEPGSAVRIKFFRRGFTNPMEVSIKRQTISVESVLHEPLPGEIGYIRIRRFGERTTEELDKALKDLKQNHKARGIVLDLRDNPGGLLRSGVEVADRFLASQKLIVYSQGKETSAPRKDYFSNGDESDEAFPLVVLVNEGSASASEIVAGSIQDHGRGPLIGSTTYGKGSVQQIIPLETTNHQTQLRLTIAKYYLPTGRCIHGQGLKADIDVKEESEDQWVLMQMETIRDTHVVEDYVRAQWASHQELMKQLATQDDRRIEKYPTFEALYEKVEGFRISREDLRKEVRRTTRLLAQDDRRQEFAYDLQEDMVLQQGVFQLLGKLHIDPSSVVQYRPFFKKIAKEVPAEPKLGAFVTSPTR